MKSTSPRLVRTFGVLAATALVATGCAQGTPEQPAGGGDATATVAAATEISVWFPGANQAEIDLVNDTIVPAFEKETGADVEVTFVDWGDLSPKLNAAFAAGTAPDVFGHGPAAVADFVANTRVEDLGPYLDKLDPALLEDVSGALPGGQVNGAQYLIPLSIQGNLLAYDADAFTAAGLDPDNPPTTWEGVLDAAKKLTVRDGDTITRAGLLVPSNKIGTEQSFAGFLSAAGGSILNEDGTEVAFDSPEGEKALNFFTGLYSGDEPVANMLGEDYVNMPPAQQPLVIGGTAMAVLTAPTMKQAFSAAPDKDLRVMPPLSFEGGETAMWGGSGPGLMINADSEAKDLAWTFISYLLQPDVSAQYTEGIGAVPVHASAVESDYVKSNPVVQAYVAATPFLVPNPNVTGWVAMRDALDARLAEALFGTADVPTTLSTAADEVGALLSSNS